MKAEGVSVNGDGCIMIEGCNCRPDGPACKESIRACKCPIVRLTTKNCIGAVNAHDADQEAAEKAAEKKKKELEEA